MFNNDGHPLAIGCEWMNRQKLKSLLLSKHLNVDILVVGLPVDKAHVFSSIY
jgi:hypothetical protein